MSPILAVAPRVISVSSLPISNRINCPDSGATTNCIPAHFDDDCLAGRGVPNIHDI